MASPVLRRYLPSDLVNVKKDALVEMIRAQTPEFVPKPFNPSKWKVAELREKLLAIDSPFRKMEVSHTSLTTQVTEAGTLPKESSMLQITPREVPNSLSPDLNQDVSGGSADSCERSELIDLRVYIEDHRFSGFLQNRTVRNVSIRGTEFTDHTGEQYVRFSTTELLEEIQRGKAAISGSEAVKIGFKDDDSPDFIEFFVESEPVNLHISDTYPEEFSLSLDCEPKITILVDFENRQPTTVNEHVANVSQSSAGAQASASVTSSTRPRHELIDWLKEKATEQTGHDFFLSSRHRPIQNPEALRSWKFIAEFSERYFKKTHHFAYKNKKVLKSDIYAALGIKETSLGDAEEAIRILRIFGEGGSHPVQLVIDEASRETDPPQGSVRFLKFLKLYDKEHSSAL